MMVNLTNETQFVLKYEKEWFDVGRFWDAPSNTAAFRHSFFTGCNTFGVPLDIMVSLVLCFSLCKYLVN